MVHTQLHPKTHSPLAACLNLGLTTRLWQTFASLSCFGPAASCFLEPWLTQCIASQGSRTNLEFYLLHLCVTLNLWSNELGIKCGMTGIKVKGAGSHFDGNHYIFTQHVHTCRCNRWLRKTFESCSAVVFNFITKN